MANLIYKKTEIPFIKYFERMVNVGNDYNQIEKQLPYLNEYYFDMVIKKCIIEDYFLNEPTIFKLFNMWKNNKNND